LNQKIILCVDWYIFQINYKRHENGEQTIFIGCDGCVTVIVGLSDEVLSAEIGEMKVRILTNGVTHCSSGMVIKYLFNIV